MLRLEDLQTGTVLRGLAGDRLATVKSVHRHGDEVLEVIYEDGAGKLDKDFLGRSDEPALEIAAAGRPWSFDGDGELLRLVSEALMFICWKGRSKEVGDTVKLELDIDNSGEVLQQLTKQLSFPSVPMCVRHLTHPNLVRAEKGNTMTNEGFLRGKFLETWRRCSDSLTPHLSGRWSGPWQVLGWEKDGAAVWELYRDWEDPGETIPAGEFRSHPMAHLVAALLPYREVPHGYAVGPASATAPGEVVSLLAGEPGEVVGRVHGCDGGRLESALGVVGYLCASPEALAVVLECAGYEVVVRALETVSAQIDILCGRKS